MTDISTPAPMVTTDLIATGLGPKLSEDSLTLDRDVINAYASDEALFCPADGALALVRAQREEDVQETLRFASAHRIPIVPQGARTGISGGANAVPGCLLLSVAGLDQIVRIDPDEHLAVVQPGVINADLKQALVPYDLAYPPDPGSVAISSIGGNIATNAGGLCCVKYGVTRDYVRALRVVLADGTLTSVGTPTAKGVAGLDLCGLFVGSEGTLGVIVEATLRVLPKLPQPLTAVATFADDHASAQVVADVMADSRPSMLESLDQTSLAMLNAYGDFGLAEAGAMLLMQSDGGGSPERSWTEVQHFAAAAENRGALDVAFSEDPADSAALVAARRMIQPAWEKYAHAHGGGQLLDDVCLPRTRLTEFYAKLDSIRAACGLTISVVAHAGDGNVHPSIFFDTDDQAQVTAAGQAFDAIMQLGLDLGGTITGEHGVGYLKRGWLASELDAGNRRSQLAIKAALDPLGILNPGKMFAKLA